jgi:hypothetical protein
MASRAVNPSYKRMAICIQKLLFPAKRCKLAARGEVRIINVANNRLDRKWVKHSVVEYHL